MIGDAAGSARLDGTAVRPLVPEAKNREWSNRRPPFMLPSRSFLVSVPFAARRAPAQVPSPEVAI